MKKVLAVITLVLLMCSLAACGQKGSNEGQKNDGKASEKKPIKAEIAAPEVKDDTIVGSTVPRNIYESDKQLIFYTHRGVFFYDKKSDKITNAFAINGDDAFLLNQQGIVNAVVVPN